MTFNSLFYFIFSCEINNILLNIYFICLKNSVFYSCSYKKINDKVLYINFNCFLFCIYKKKLAKFMSLCLTNIYLFDLLFNFLLYFILFLFMFFWLKYKIINFFKYLNLKCFNMKNIQVICPMLMFFSLILHRKS